jgi:small-conductance mechanosensitive channel
MLKSIGIDNYFSNAIRTFFSFEINIGVISFSLGGMIIFFLIIWLSIILSKMVRIILEIDILDKLNLAKGVPHTIAMLVRYTLVTLGVVFAVGAAGLPLQNFTILFGAFGVGIGFGLQNIFNNLVSGLILLFERPIQIGDTIEVGELIGHVKSIGIRSSNIRTFDGAEVIVPNGQLISNEVVNWTLSDQQRRIEVIAGVAYGTDPHKVKSLLTNILVNHPDIIQNPAPVVLFSNMGESSLDFRLLFWTSNMGEWLRIQSEITFLVHDTLKENGIEIPFPQRDLHIKSIESELNITKKENN